MSIFGAMFSGVSGLSAQSQYLGMISDNISNVNTIGYKGTTARFSTLVTQNATATSFSPGGVQSLPFQVVDKQGLLQAASSPTDIAIKGKGFFAVNQSANPGPGDETLFTRAGAFTPDADGNLRNSGGFYLMGWPTDSNGVPTVGNTNVLSSLQTVNVSGLNGSALATTNMSIGANLPASASTGETDNITAQFFDSLGVSHNLPFTFTKAGSNQWDVSAQPPSGTTSISLTDSSGQVYAAAGQLEFGSIPSDGDTIDIGGTTYEFDTDGSVTAGNTTVDISGATTASDAAAALVTAVGDSRITQDGSTVRISQSSGGAALTVDASGTSAVTQSTTGAFTVPATANLSPGITFDGNGVPSAFNVAHVDIVNTDGASPSSIDLNLGTVGKADGVTQFASDFTTNFLKQNGLTYGSFSGVTVGDDGIVTALFDNGQSAPIYKIPIATFANPNGMLEQTGNVFAATQDSGDPLLNTAGSGAAGSIASGSLEASTVDIANEFTNMIVTQQAYSASARIITTANQMLDEIIRIGR